MKKEIFSKRKIGKQLVSVAMIGLTLTPSVSAISSVYAEEAANDATASTDVSAQLKAAIETLDAKFFQQIPGIWPKLAKKIILELKGTFDLQQAESIDTKHKIFKSVVKTLKNLGYDATKVQEVLRTYEGNLDQADLSEVVKWTISRL